MVETMKLPHIYRDYHVQSFGYVGMDSVHFIVTGVDIILVVHSYKDLVLLRRQRDQISPVHCNIDISIGADCVNGFFISVCCNKHNNLFLIVHMC